MFFLPLLLAASVADAPTTWVYEENRDEMTDLSGATAGLLAQEREIALAFRCELHSKSRPLVMLIARTENREIRSSDRMMTIRFDDGKAKVYVWDIAYGTAYVSDDRELRELLRSMSAAQVMKVRMLDVSGQYVSGTFDLRGTAQAVDIVLNQCGKPDYLKRK